MFRDAATITLADTSTGEGLVIHLWKDRASYEANASAANG